MHFSSFLLQFFLDSLLVLLQRKGSPISLLLLFCHLFLSFNWLLFLSWLVCDQLRLPPIFCSRLGYILARGSTIFIIEMAFAGAIERGVCLEVNYICKWRGFKI